MKKILGLFALILSVVACQKDPSRTDLQNADTFSSSDVQLVQAADGTLYSKSCLAENAANIQSKGASAMATCKMVVKLNSSTGTGETERSRFFYNSSYAYIFYPPTYCNSSNSSSSNAFWKFIFGNNYNNYGVNWYSLLGYNNSSNYSQYYNPSCNYCLYAPNPTRCQNRCYSYHYYSVY